MFKEIYQIVQRIPEGKVSTYGEVARVLGIKDVRKIGWALHKNTSADIPCHRVVNKDGQVAPGFAFGGPREQRNRLIAEGVTFLDEEHVDLAKHLITL